MLDYVNPAAGWAHSSHPCDQEGPCECDEGVVGWKG